MEYKQEIKYVGGFKVVNNFPDYTPEEEERANQNILQRIYGVLYSDEENN